MILVFGGTTEGKKVAKLLQGEAMPFVYSTKTNIPFKVNEIVSYRHGALDEKALEAYLLKHKIHTIINASHPFAEILHSTIAKVAERLQIPVIRFGRKLLPKTKHSLVTYVHSYDEGFNLLQEHHILLALTGVQSIKRLKPWWQKHTSYFRILDRAESLAIANESKFPKEQLILGLPSANLENEINLITKNNINIILTKETGNSGFLSTKIEAALKTNAQIIIIKQPKIPSYFQQVVDETELHHLLITTHPLDVLTKNSTL